MKISVITDDQIFINAVRIMHVTVGDAVHVIFYGSGEDSITISDSTGQVSVHINKQKVADVIVRCDSDVDQLWKSVHSYIFSHLDMK